MPRRLIYRLACDRVAIQRRSLIRLWYKHVPIDVAPNSLLAAVETEIHASSQRCHDLEAIVIRTSRLDASDLKERARAEDTVVVCFVDSAVQSGRCRVRLMKGRGRRAADLGAEVTGLSLELLDDRCRGAEPLVELPLHRVVNQRDPDVLVAAALARRGIRLAQEIEFRAVRPGIVPLNGVRGRVLSGGG